MAEEMRKAAEVAAFAVIAGACVYASFAAWVWLIRYAAKGSC